MAIDTSGDRPDKVIADIPHGASAPGGALTRRPSETVKTYDSLGSLLPGGEEAAGGVHFIHYDGASYAVGRRKGADEPHAADKCELEASTSRILPMTQCAFTSWRSAGSTC